MGEKVNKAVNEPKKVEAVSNELQSRAFVDPRTANEQPKHPAKYIILAVLSLLIIAAIIAGWQVHHSREATKKNAQKTEATDFDEMIKAEEYAHNHGQDDIAKKAIMDFMAEYPSNGDKTQLYQIDTALTAIYNTAGDFKTALKWQNKSFDNSSKHTFNDYYELAEACLHVDDKTCAKKNYQLALDAINNGEKPSGVDAFKNYINIKLKALNS